MSGGTLFRIGLWAMAALMAGAAISLFLIYGRGESSSVEAPYGTPFQLVDQNGQEITEMALRGGPSAVFFGFTHCPDVCPTTLFELAGYQQALKEEGRDLKVVLVTVDPERDTPEVLKDYVEALSPDITAITGEPEEIAAMLKGWGVYARKIEEDDGYTMDHTATVFLIDGEGRFAGTISPGENPETARQKLENLTDV